MLKRKIETYLANWKKSAFTGNIDVDTIILNLSALIPGSRFVSGKTCIILDEIQECKEARTALKSFHIDGRFDVIATGSLLGVRGYGQSNKKKEEEGKDSHNSSIYGLSCTRQTHRYSHS